MSRRPRDALSKRSAVSRKKARSLLPAAAVKRKSLSKIIRHIKPAPSVVVGEQQIDALLEERAAVRLGEIMPRVQFQTNPDGRKVIPIQEVFLIAQALKDEKEMSYKQGLLQGHQRGLEEGRDEARAVLGQFDRAIKDAIDHRSTLLEQARSKILELVLQISRKVTFDAIEADREITIEIINRVIDQLVDRSKLKIKVHPDHLPIMEQNIDRFLIGSTTIKEITFEADPRVRFGGCFIETPSGDIDARLESGFEVVGEAIHGEEDRP
ncbi:hypothetical protein C3F09_12675 [candidate division GN15 bacterium]|uniref:Flagellar assembly protein FliH/Type III secretion system HrpE domain-containing protein n=1 Tax=candidate division GN15 bacterium TaxID=2072418 RepID=A0A855WX07_9BACT|nr:MAG: hypothetical protein C3F09_12675 [candidate division GN15 bacterium]